MFVSNIHILSHVAFQDESSPSHLFLSTEEDILLQKAVLACEGEGQGVIIGAFTEEPLSLDIGKPPETVFTASEESDSEYSDISSHSGCSDVEEPLTEIICVPSDSDSEPDSEALTAMLPPLFKGDGSDKFNISLQVCHQRHYCSEIRAVTNVT